MARIPKSSPTRPEAAHTLEGVDLFAVGDAALRHAYEKRCIWQWWDKDAVILDRAASSADVFFVVAGRVRIVNYSASGHREVALDEVKSGGYFGELAAIDGEPRSASVTAVTRTLTARLPGAAFVEYLMEHPPAALAMMRRLTEIVRSAGARILDLSTVAAQARIYTDLLREARTGPGLPPNQAAIRPVPRHHVIAARASTTRETVARALGELARRGLVAREGGALVIRDVAALTRLAGEGAP